jgi:cytoskeletal protein CcmA (bactofilin family)
MTHIGPSVHITGDIAGEEDLTIHGRVTGSVILRDHTVLIAPAAHVDADLRGARVVVLGQANGAITAAERIELGPAAIVTGSLSANHVVISEGACFNGSIDMNQRTIAARLANYKAAHGPPGRPTTRHGPVSQAKHLTGRRS